MGLHEWEAPESNQAPCVNLLREKVKLPKTLGLAFFSHIGLIINYLYSGNA